MAKPLGQIPAVPDEVAAGDIGEPVVREEGVSRRPAGRGFGVSAVARGADFLDHRAQIDHAGLVRHLARGQGARSVAIEEIIHLERVFEIPDGRRDVGELFAGPGLRHEAADNGPDGGVLAGAEPDLAQVAFESRQDPGQFFVVLGHVVVPSHPAEHSGQILRLADRAQRGHQIVFRVSVSDEFGKVLAHRVVFDVQILESRDPPQFLEALGFPRLPADDGVVDQFRAAGLGRFRQLFAFARAGHREPFDESLRFQPRQKIELPVGPWVVIQIMDDPPAAPPDLADVAFDVRDRIERQVGDVEIGVFEFPERPQEAVVILDERELVRRPKGRRPHAVKYVGADRIEIPALFPVVRPARRGAAAVDHANFQPVLPRRWSHDKPQPIL